MARFHLDGTPAVELPEEEGEPSFHAKLTARLGDKLDHKLSWRDHTRYWLQHLYVRLTLVWPKILALLS